MLSVRIEVDLLKELKHAAVDLDRPIADIVEEAIRELLAKQNRPAK